MKERSLLVFFAVIIILFVRILFFNLDTAKQTKPAEASLVMLGGDIRYDNAEVFNKVIELAGGKDANIAVFPTASDNPVKKGNEAVEAFKKYGAKANIIPVAVNNVNVDNKKAVTQKNLIKQVKDCTGVYFIGGDEEKITQTLYTESGENTPMLNAIWDVYKKGGVIAGSSAGAAIMSTTMFKDAMDVLSILKYGVQEGKEIDKGLGFIGSDIFVAQHFLTRGRFASSLVVMQQKGYKMGIGVDENTAVVVKNGIAEAIGYKGALVMDLSSATSNPNLPEFNIQNAKFTYLARGDKFNLKTKEVIPSPLKIAGTKVEPNNPNYKFSYEGDKFYPDVLANTVLVDLMSNLIDNKQKEVIGLAFTKIPDDKKPELGFEFKFRKGMDSMGYFTEAFGGEDYTVMNIYVDVTPIRMRDKLYEYISK